MQYYQFILLAERYYKPAEKLPSGRSPIQKAMSRNMEPVTNAQRSPIMRSFGGTPVKVSSREVKRREMQRQRIGKVKRGADNPHWDTTPHPDYEIKKTKYFGRPDWSGDLTYHHKPSGISYNVYNVGKDRDGSISYGIQWKHNQQPKTHREKMRLINTAREVGKHVLSRAPHNSVVWNVPDENANPINPVSGRPKKTSGNVRSKEYEKIGMGPASQDIYGHWNAQVARVGRQPSSRRRAKNKNATSLKPLEGFPD